MVLKKLLNYNATEEKAFQLIIGRDEVGIALFNVLSRTYKVDSQDYEPEITIIRSTVWVGTSIIKYNTKLK